MTVIERISELVAEMMKRGEYISPSVILSGDIFHKLRNEMGTQIRYTTSAAYSSVPESIEIYTYWGLMKIEVTTSRTDYIAINGRTLEDIIVEEILLGDT